MVINQTQDCVSVWTLLAVSHFIGKTLFNIKRRTLASDEVSLSLLGGGNDAKHKYIISLIFVEFYFLFCWEGNVLLKFKLQVGKIFQTHTAAVITSVCGE